MAFSFHNAGNDAMDGGAGGIQNGPDLEDIRTEVWQDMRGKGSSSELSNALSRHLDFLPLPVMPKSNYLRHGRPTISLRRPPPL